MRNAIGVAWAGFAGVLGAVSGAWPLHGVFEYGQAVWWMQLASLLLYAKILVCCVHPRDAARVGFTYHLALVVGSIYWLHIAMDTYGGLPSPLAWTAVVVLSMVLSIYGAVMAWLYARIGCKRLTAAPLVFAACWGMAELARGQWFTGFGWAASSYAHVDGPFAALSPWIGGYGIAFVVAALSGAVALIINASEQKTWKPIVAIAMLIFGANLAPDFTASTGQFKATLLQGNIAQDEKFDNTRGVVQSLAWYGRSLEESDASLVLAPETAIPVLPQQLPSGYLEGLTALAIAQRSVKLVGIPLGDSAQGYTNSVIALGHSDFPSYFRYDKHHLVPFGEFIPPLFKWFVRMMHIPLGDFNRGDLRQTALAVEGQRIGPSICYEDLFSEELASRFEDTTQSPTIFANFSNLAWFGESTAMYQHLHISRMRSLEFGRPFLRVSNSGITSVVDHHGRVTAQLEPYTRGVLNVMVEGRSGLTPYAWWSSRLSTWLLWLLCLGIVGWAWRCPVQRGIGTVE